jgi:hypothetical protein
LDDRYCKSKRLAGAGWRSAAHVAPCECVGESCFLNRKGGGYTVAFEQRDDFGGNAEIGESGGQQNSSQLIK